MPAQAAALEINAEFPEALDILWQSSRYKVLYGGRGGAKSWGAARALLIKAIERPLRILCARETQKSIAESVHRLLSDQVAELGLQSFYQILQSTIIGSNGSEFIFAGLKHNVSNIKSLEACDIVWVEEAQVVSKTSWEVLIPTIRKDKSEIWVTFNPDLQTDDTYQRFVLHPPPGALVKQVTWRDNPWFPDVLRTEMEHLKGTDPDAYLHVWEGKCLASVEGAIFAKELRQADTENRIRSVPYDPLVPVHTFWDLGFGDMTAIWFAQAVGPEYHLIDYLENSGEALGHYQREIQRKPYVYAYHHLPHDAQAHDLRTGRSIEELMRSAGFPVKIVPKLSLTDGINALRTIFPQCYFDQGKCADGVQALRHYIWAPEGALGLQKREPVHNWASHGSSALRYFAVGIKRDLARPVSVRHVNLKPVSCWS